MSDAVHVAVGVVQAADGRVLVAHRDAWRHQGGALEFPGGKIEPGESSAHALAREFIEEVGIRPLDSHKLIRVRHRYPDRRVVLEVYRVTRWAGEPAATAGAAVAWRSPAELVPDSFPRANRPILAVLQRPPVSPVTTPLTDGSPDSLERLVAACRAIMSEQRCLIRVRRGAVGGDGWQRALAHTASLAGAFPGSCVVVDARGTDPSELPIDIGLHLPAAELQHHNGRPIEAERLCTCACHTQADLDRAQQLGVDLAYLGPVASTPSHPGGKGLGWGEFARLAENTALPLYAIGGVGPNDLARARRAGALGVAGIRAFWSAGNDSLAGRC